MSEFFSIISIATADSLSAVSEKPPGVPRFSIGYMDPTIEPGLDFYHYAEGTWLKNNPVPPDKSRWASFSELQERNWRLIHEILDGTTNGAVQKNSPAEKVRNFYLSAMDTNRIEKIGFKPLEAHMKRIEELKSKEDLFHVVATFHQEGIGVFFSDGVSPDAKK